MYSPINFENFQAIYENMQHHELIAQALELSDAIWNFTPTNTLQVEVAQRELRQLLDVFTDSEAGGGPESNGPSERSLRRKAIADY